MLDRVYDRDAGISVFQGCWIKCLTEMHGTEKHAERVHGVFDSHAVWDIF